MQRVNPARCFWAASASEIPAEFQWIPPAKPKIDTSIALLVGLQSNKSAIRLFQLRSFRMITKAELKRVLPWVGPAAGVTKQVPAALDECSLQTGLLSGG